DGYVYGTVEVGGEPRDLVVRVNSRAVPEKGASGSAASALLITTISGRRRQFACPAVPSGIRRAAGPMREDPMPPLHRPGRPVGAGGPGALARGAFVLAAALALLTPLAGVAPAAPRTAAVGDVAVRVNAQAALGRLSDTARGVNTTI
ncbi:hypothetical protein ACWCQV_39580, partial [Streptomyces eurythermus]